MNDQYTLYDFLKEASSYNAEGLGDYYEKYGKLPPEVKIQDAEYGDIPLGLPGHIDDLNKNVNVAKKKLLTKRKAGIGLAGLTAVGGGAYLLKKRHDRKKAREEKVASFDRAAGIARNVGGKALKAVNPVGTVVGVASSAKNSAIKTATKQGYADELMGVSGRFNKIASSKKEEEDKRYSHLYKKKKGYLTAKQRAAIASGLTLGGVGLYGAIKEKDVLWGPKVLNRNKLVFGSKAMNKMIYASPFKDVAQAAADGIRDSGSAKLNAVGEANAAAGAAEVGKNNNVALGLAKTFGTALAAGAGYKAGDAIYQRVVETARAKKLAREKEEQERADAYSKGLKAEDLFKKASIATGDDIVTAVNKSVEKFLPEEIKKRQERRNRYNSTVDYVDHGAHGGDAPQRRNK